jgi:hypothetical protein
MKSVVFLITFVMPVMADMQFRMGRMTRDEVPLGKGQCDIRLQIDKEAEVKVRGDMVFVRTLSGREARDDGSECNEPLPEGADLQGFNFEVRDSRGEIILLSPPSGRNGYAAVVRIRDSAGGAGRYHFRLSWGIGGYGSGHSGPPPRNPFGVREAIQVCRDAVASRIVDQYNFGDVNIRNIRADDRPGRRDYVLGEASARRGFRETGFSFVCGVNFDSGRVRSVEVRKR